MLKTTQSAIRAVLSTDPTVSPVQINAAIAELEGKGSRHLGNTQPLDRVLSRKQAAEVLGCSVKSVSERAKSGRLVGVYGGANGQRLTGISEASVRRFIETSGQQKNDEAAA